MQQGFYWKLYKIIKVLLLLLCLITLGLLISSFTSKYDTFPLFLPTPKNKLLFL
jgi:hypothetical protein